MDQARVLRGQTVIVKDGEITKIGPASTIKTPGDSLRIIGRGKYLMPGLADMHVHLLPAFAAPRMEAQYQEDRHDNYSMFELFVAGLTPYEAIKTATADAA